ncbi:hypothetical protein [Bradyrhizobium yuanmingense]|uniref:hypothetical protein n=1 Tax=Bradyrhizobium yuanmingense TaxID=108015 RepID=UPI0023B9CCFE|nr:hypothetical protein [Bradyrhizobium yuanmingense]MDF0492078.1 hypothetical protein [Bradyrhizobium yuanmingense]
MERSSGRAGGVLICLNVGVAETARRTRMRPAPGLIAGTLASCQCFARRVNLMAAATAVFDTARKCLFDQRASYCAWGCFSTFVLALRSQRSRIA